MATKRTKIGALIAIDGEQSFKASISRCKASVAAMKSELDGLNSKYKGNANSMEALAAVQSKYAEIQSTAAKQVEKMGTAYEASTKKQEQIRASLEGIGEAYDKARATLDEMTTSGEASEEQIAAQAKVVKDAQQDYDTLAAALEKAATRTEQYRKALAEAKTVQTEAAASAAEYAGYLTEAQSNPAGVALSLDENGQKIKVDHSDLKEAAEDAAEASGALDTFKGVLGGNFATKGLEKVCDLLKQGAKYAIDVGSDFEAAMSKVEAISGATGSEYETMSKKAKQLGADTVFSATDAANAFSYMALAGWDVDAMMGGIDGVLDLAAASAMDLADASAIVTNYINAFGLSSSDATHMADVMSTAMTKSATDTTELGEAYKNCATTAGSMHYSLEEVTAALMTMANSGVKCGEAGTTLNAIMTRLASNSSGCADELAKYGVEIYNADGSMKSLSSILIAVSDAFAGLSDQEQANLAKTMAGVEQYSGLQSILKGLSNQAKENGTSFQDYTEILQSCDGAAEEMADTMSDNLKGDLDDLSSAAEGLGVTLYDAFGDKVRGAAQTLSGAIGLLSDSLQTQDTTMTRYLDDVSSQLTASKEATAEAEAQTAEAESTAAELAKNISTITSTMDLPDISGYTKAQLEEALQAVKDYAPDFSDAFKSVADFTAADSSTRQAFLDELNKSLQKSQLNTVSATLSEYQTKKQNATQDVQIARQAMADTVEQLKKYKQQIAEWEQAKEDAKAAYSSDSLVGLIQRGWSDLSMEASTEGTEIAQVYNTMEELTKKFAEYKETVDTGTESLEDLDTEQKAYVETQQAFLDSIGVTIDENGNLVDTLEGVTDATEDAADATDAAADSAEKATVSIEGLEEEQNSALQAFLDASDAVDSSGFSKAIEKQMTEAADKVTAYKETLQNALSIDALSNSAGDALDSVFGTSFADRVDAIEKSVLNARWAVKYFYEDIQALEAAGAPQELVDSLLSRGVEDAYSDAETLAQLAESDQAKFQEIMGYWQDVQSWQDEAENSLLKSYTETIMDGIDGGYSAWYEYGIRTTQGLFDAITEVQQALEDGGALESLGDFDTAFQSVLQAKAQVGNYAGANTQTQTTATPTSESQPIQIKVTAELDGQKMYDTLVRYDRSTGKQTGTR